LQGPILGSIIGNYLVLPSLGTFVWPFRFLTILTGLNTLVIFFIMRETYEPVCRRVWDAEQEAQRTGDEGGEIKKGERKVKAISPSAAQTKEVFLRALTRPPRMLANPVCVVFGTYYAYVYAIVYVSLVSL
jgi:DHA1 family multidrug resistance protein-like MFS transporter